MAVLDTAISGPKRQRDVRVLAYGRPAHDDLYLLERIVLPVKVKKSV